jgi:hypothetical protein
VVGFFVAATVVALMQLLRTRDWRALPLLLLFLCLAQAHSRDWRDPWRDRFHFLAGGCGLALLFVLSPGHKPTR